jgi:hypothetical protein
VQPEQLKSFKGHLPRLARLLHIPQFVKSIARVHVDEAHFHFTAGLPHYGLPAFRPSWGALNELRIRLPKGVPVQALSATLPPHIKSAIIEHLNFDPNTFISLKLSCNRPNIVYATHRIVGTLSDFRNLDFLISIPFTPLLKVLVFHDDTQQTADATAYLDKRLPVELRNKGIVRHYHGGMSKAYLTQVFDDFSNDNGVCRILNGTEGISTVHSSFAFVQPNILNHKRDWTWKVSTLSLITEHREKNRLKFSVEDEPDDVGNWQYIFLWLNPGCTQPPSTPLTLTAPIPTVPFLAAYSRTRGNRPVLV